MTYLYLFLFLLVPWLSTFLVIDVLNIDNFREWDYAAPTIITIMVVEIALVIKFINTLVNEECEDL